MLASILFLGCLGQDPLPAQDPRELFGVARGEEADRARSLQAALDTELAAGRLPAWAGTYGTGHGLGGQSLTLAPRAGFLLTSWTDLPGHDKWTYGPVTTTGSSLYLHLPQARPPVPAANPLLQRLYTIVYDPDLHLVPITWGERRYLVEERALQSFCREIREGAPAFGAFLRRGDEERPVSGRPRTPDSDLRCLDEQPIAAHIVSIGTTTPEGSGPGRSVVTNVTLDVGAKDGVRPGMRFSFRDTKDAQLTFHVVDVRRETSEAVIEYQPLYADRPRIGWLLSTDWPPKKR